MTFGVLFSKVAPREENEPSLPPTKAPVEKVVLPAGSSFCLSCMLFKSLCLPSYQNSFSVSSLTVCQLSDLCYRFNQTGILVAQVAPMERKPSPPATEAEPSRVSVEISPLEGNVSL